jgi:hypothetical protein
MILLKQLVFLIIVFNVVNEDIMNRFRELLKYNSSIIKD